MSLRTGFIGLGNIGRPMAVRLVASGMPTTVYDISEEAVRELEAAGATPATSPAALATQCDVIGVCVRDDTDVVGHPHVTGRGLGVAAVEFGVRTRLLGDEDVDAELQNVVQLAGRELGELPVADLHRAEPSVGPCPP